MRWKIFCRIYVGLARGRAPTSANRNIKRLDVANNNLFEIKRETFNNYPELEELNIINSGVTSIADKAFYDLPHLSRVNMSKNFITSLSHKIFRPRSKLWKFDVSSNMLNNLDTFDVSYFPELELVDVSNNQLRFLPESFIRKLESGGGFRVISYNNPWNCQHKNWSHLLSENLRKEFCADEARLDLTQTLALKLPPQANFVTCALWVFGAFWVGLIAGNMCLIKKIIFPEKPIVKVDQSTNTHHGNVSFQRHGDSSCDF